MPNGKSIAEIKKELERNHQFFEENESRLRDKYSGEYIAILGCKVVYHSSSSRTLVDKLVRRHGDEADCAAIVYMERIKPSYKYKHVGVAS